MGYFSSCVPVAAGIVGVLMGNLSEDPYPLLPAHLVLAELVPHTLVIQSDPGIKGQNRYKNDDGEDDENQGFRIRRKQDGKYRETRDEQGEQDKVH